MATAKTVRNGKDGDMASWLVKQGAETYVLALADGSDHPFGFFGERML
jgi:hypothetical protein